MFNGDDECCDCTETPPPCNECIDCRGLQPGNCSGQTCPSFVIEVEGFANTTTAVNATQFGCEATGTLCGAYNGTFVLEPTVNPCIFASDVFTATIPRVSEINVGPIGSPASVFCYTCEEGQVYWQLTLYTRQSPTDPNVWMSNCYIDLVEEGGTFSARFTTTFDGPNDDIDGSLIGPNGEYQPASLCNAEGIAQTVNSKFWPMRVWNHISAPYPPSSSYLSQPSWGLVFPAYSTDQAFIGRTNPQLTESDSYGWNECNVATEFDASPDDSVNGIPGDQFWPVHSPHWICCKDDSWDCDYVRDEIASGNKNGQKTPLFRITGLRCGT